jgi:hypothetical protein
LKTITHFFGLFFFTQPTSRIILVVFWRIWDSLGVDLPQPFKFYIVILLVQTFEKDAPNEINIRGLTIGLKNAQKKSSQYMKIQLVNKYFVPVSILSHMSVCSFYIMISEMNFVAFFTYLYFSVLIF